jgi:putative membrane protein
MKKISLFEKSLRTIKILSVCLLLGIQVSCDDDDDDNNQPEPQGQVQTLSATDRQFMINAAYANRAEIELGTVAATNGTHDSVKAYGQRMVNEHTLAQNELKTLAANNQVTIPDTLDAMHKALKKELQTYTGERFDSTYINSQIVDHQLSIQNFQTEVNQGQKQDVKNYAVKNLPHLEVHYSKAVQTKTLLQENEE